MSEIPQEAVTAAAEALRKHLFSLPYPEVAAQRTLEAAWPSVKAVIEERTLAAARQELAKPLAALGAELAAHGAAAERVRCASLLEAYAGNYPEDVFPAMSGSRDAISGTAMRHAYRNAARILREASGDQSGSGP